MYRYFKAQNDLTFQIECYESYSKTKAEQTARGLSEKELDTTFIEGNLEVKNVTILQPKYSKKAVSFSKNTASRLYKYIKELEAEKCKQSLTDYYS